MINTVSELLAALQTQVDAGLGDAALRVVPSGVTQRRVATVLQVIEANENKILMYLEE